MVTRHAIGAVARDVREPDDRARADVIATTSATLGRET
jgi:hypothetical protein